MDIHLVSTLTAEDEERVASVVLSTLSELLDKLPIAYAVRVETTGAHVMQHTHLEVGDAEEGMVTKALSALSN